MKGEKQNMNKFLQKVAKIFLGLSMAAGVGVSFGLNKKAISTDAATAVSWSRSGTTDTVTSGFTFSSEAASKSGYYQDGGSVGDKRYVQAFRSSTAMWTTTPSSVKVTAKIGGGTAFNIVNPVYAVLLDVNGDEILSTQTVVTDNITNKDGATYSNLSMPAVATAYGLRIYHIKENNGSSGYNVRYYSFSLTYEAGSTTPAITPSKTSTSGYTGTNETITFSYSNLTSNPVNIAVVSGDTSKVTISNLTFSSGSGSVKLNFIATTTTAVTVSFKDGGTNGTQRATCSVTVNQSQVSITGLPSSSEAYIGTDTLDLGSLITVTPTGSCSNTVSWESDDESVATVSTLGVVSGLKEGTANIKVTAIDYTSATMTCSVTVVPAPKIYTIIPQHNATSDSSSDFEVFSTTDYEYNSNAITSSGGSKIYNGGNNTIKIGASSSRGSITISLNHATEYVTSVVVNAYKYGSDNNKISIVPTGGSAITASPNENLGSTAKDYTFTISGTSCTSFSLTTTNAKRGYINSISIYYSTIEPVAMTLNGANNKTTITSLSSTLQLTAKAYSDSEKENEITGLSFTYSSATTSVATVDENGLVTPVSTGQSIITARYSATLSADITITVLYVSVDLINDGSVLEASSSGTFSYSWSSDSLKPSSPSVTWSASGSGVTITNASTGAYTAGADGSSATVTVTVTKDGYTYTASRDFSVVSSVVLPTHISVTESSGVLTYVGSEVSLHITVLGENDEEATNQNVVCSSSNTDVLTVSNTGVITAKARGLVTVTIVDEGSLCDPVEVSVRVRNAVRSEAPLIGSADVGATKNYSTSDNFITTHYTEGTATPSVTISGQYATKPSNITWSYTCLRLATGSVSGAVAFEYDSSVKIKTVIVTALGWDDDECDGLSISDASLEEGELNYDVGFTDLVFTFEEVTNSFTINCQSGHRAYISQIKIYGEKSDGSSSENAQAVYTFEETYMHLDDYNSNLGYCNDSEHHYYSSAKSAFNALTEPRRKLFLENEAFAEAKERLMAWAEANNESIDASYQLSSNRNILPVLLNQNTNTIALIVIISMVSMTAIGGYFFLRKRKENI